MSSSLFAPRIEPRPDSPLQTVVCAAYPSRSMSVARRVPVGVAADVIGFGASSQGDGHERHEFLAVRPAAGAASFAGRRQRASHLSATVPISFALSLRGAALELVTLGFYRFWLATDMRRHLWSNTTVEGDAPNTSAPRGNC